MDTSSITLTLQQIRALLSRHEKIRCLWIVGLSCVTSLLEMATAAMVIFFGKIMLDPTEGLSYLTPLGFPSTLSPGRGVFYTALMVGTLYVLKNILAGVEAFFRHFSIQKMQSSLQHKLSHLYADSDYGFYLTRNSSFGITVMDSDVEKMFFFGATAIATILSEGIIFCSLLGLIIFINPPLTLIILGLGSFLTLGFKKLFLPVFYKNGQEMQEKILLADQNLRQFFHGFKEIILLGKKRAFISAYHSHALEKSRLQALNASLNDLPRLIIESVFMGLFVLAIAFLCWNHKNPAQMTGLLGGYLYAGFRLMPGLNRIVTQLNVLKSSMPYIHRVGEEVKALSIQETYMDVPDFHFTQNIVLKNVSFQYINTHANALSHISLVIKKGECVGIVGATGSGKSTLVDLILGLLRPEDGYIRVDDTHPVNSYQWHRKIGYVPQSIYLTDDTIEKNIAFGEDHVDAKRLYTALEAAQLGTFIESLPAGIKTVVGERGIRLSGGERQRIAIARALYHSPEVLIFDEATSALDTPTEERLMDTIHGVSQGRTVIMIAHRLTTLKRCNRIVVMAKGKIKEIVSSLEEVNLS